MAGLDGRGGDGREGHRPRPDVPRLFVAVPVPAEVAARIGAVVDSARAALGDDGSRVRWVQLEGLHVTLRFLGPTPAGRVAEVAQAVDAGTADAAGFEVMVAGAGAFPSLERPRALWLGLRGGADQLADLAAKLDAELIGRGWGFEPRPFRPHLTIARTDGVRTGPKAAAALNRAAVGLEAAFRADRVVLYRSHLGHGPARYEALHTVTLA